MAFNNHFSAFLLAGFYRDATPTETSSTAASTANSIWRATISLSNGSAGSYSYHFVPPLPPDGTHDTAPFTGSLDKLADFDKHGLEDLLDTIDCLICLQQCTPDPVKEDDETATRIKSCKHVYGRNCIRRAFLETSPRCPECRSSLIVVSPELDDDYEEHLYLNRSYGCPIPGCDKELDPEDYWLNLYNHFDFVCVLPVCCYLSMTPTNMRRSTRNPTIPPVHDAENIPPPLQPWISLVTALMVPAGRGIGRDYHISIRKTIVDEEEEGIDLN